MSDGRRRPRRAARVLAAFLAESWRTLLVDVALLTGWTLALLALVRLGGWPPWVLYAGLLAGAVGYSLLASWWGEE